MCGPSSSEKSLQASSQNFAGQLQSNYGTLFGDQMDVLGKIRSSLSPTLAAGPSQNGFSGAERSALETKAINAAGGANTAAQQAARTYGAGQGGGGTSGLTSGITKQIQSQIGSGAANALAGQEGNIALEDAQQGNRNYNTALGGMEALSQGYNPNAAQSGAIGENQNAFGQASQITTENNQFGQDVAGAVTALAGSAASIAKASSGGG
jgi:hypothetical protein